MDQRPFVGHTRSVEDLQWSPTEDTVREGWGSGLLAWGGGQVLMRGSLKEGSPPLDPGLQSGAGVHQVASDSALSRYLPLAQLMPPSASGTSGQPPARPACSPPPPPTMGMSTSSAGAAGSPSCSAAGMTEPSRSGTCGSSRYCPSWTPGAGEAPATGGH